MEKEIYLGPKDFKLEWFSGSGAGGQHRNKHMNCCRITHIESGLSSVGTSSRSRVTNQREAFESLAEKILSLYKVQSTRYNVPDTVVRNYHAVRNEVHDKRTGKKLTYKEVIVGNGLEKILSGS